MTTAFDKIEGLGNDFIVVEGAAFDGHERELCDRHRGIGADGVLRVDVQARAMKVVNADGSRPEMCGNGIRCVMLWLARRGVVRVGETLSIDTDAGPHACTLLSHEGQTASVRVAMRHYAVTREIERAIDVRDQRVVGTFVSMGNPHFVVFDAARQGAERVAPEIEMHPLYPSHVNVGLAEQTGPTAIALRVFERGVGYTEACGTGACAAAAAAVETGRMARGAPITVTLPGGVLEIVIGEPGTPVYMTGPARHVFRGER